MYFKTLNYSINSIKSFFCFAIIKVDPSQFLFLRDVLVTVNLWVSWKRQGANGDLDRAIGSHMLDCFLSARCVHVKVRAHETRARRIALSVEDGTLF